MFCEGKHYECVVTAPINWYCVGSFTQEVLLTGIVFFHILVCQHTVFNTYRICKNVNLWIDGHHRGLKLENKTHDFYFVERRKDFRAFPVPRHMTSSSPRNEKASLPPRWVATASGMGPRPRKTLWCILRCWRDNFLVMEKRRRVALAATTTTLPCCCSPFGAVNSSVQLRHGKYS